MLWLAILLPVLTFVTGALAMYQYQAIRRRQDDRRRALVKEEVDANALIAQLHTELNNKHDGLWPMKPIATGIPVVITFTRLIHYSKDDKSIVGRTPWELQEPHSPADPPRTPDDWLNARERLRTDLFSPAGTRVYHHITVVIHPSQLPED